MATEVEKRREAGRLGGLSKAENAKLLASASNAKECLANPSNAKQSLANLADSVPVPVPVPVPDTKKIKKETKKENIISSLREYPLFESQKVNDAFIAFAEVRQKKRSPLTLYASKLLKDKLLELESNENKQVKIIEQSIMAGWLRFFPLPFDPSKNPFLDEE